MVLIFCYGYRNPIINCKDFGPIQRNNYDILDLKLIILEEMVEMWICITVIAEVLISLVL